MLDEYNVNAVDTLIGDIVPPESLMKTLTDRKIAEEQKITYDTQKKAQETRQGMEKETAIADMQKDIVKAQQSVEIAERTASATVKKSEGDATGVKLAVGAEAEATKMRAFAEAESTRARAQADSEAIKLRAAAQAEQITLTGSAEAGKILAIGKSTAEAYELAVKALGGENFTRYKITEELAKGHIKLIPDVLIGGTNSNGTAMDGLLGLKLMEMMDPKNKRCFNISGTRRIYKRKRKRRNRRTRILSRRAISPCFISCFCFNFSGNGCCTRFKKNTRRKLVQYHCRSCSQRTVCFLLTILHQLLHQQRSASDYWY